MTETVQSNKPMLFLRLAELGCLQETEISGTADGFFMAAVTVAELLARRGITAVPDEEGGELDCSLFFDDWYLYAVSGSGGCTYGLFKMREQEHDAQEGRTADGDTPGVTVSFVALQEAVLLDCLAEPTPLHAQLLGEEIDRVVARRGQHHSEALKRYFIRTESQGAYLIARRYTAYIASLAQNGAVAVPECYAAIYKKQGLRGRVPRFLEQNNRDAGRTVCDHQSIRIRDPHAPTEEERLAILATHTGNTSVFSFAAEVQFHARFLTQWAKIRIPGIGHSPYASAVRADMSIGDTEFAGPTPYYRPQSRMVMNQYRCHKDSDMQ